MRKSEAAGWKGSLAEADERSWFVGWLRGTAYDLLAILHSCLFFLGDPPKQAISSFIETEITSLS